MPFLAIPAVAVGVTLAATAASTAVAGATAISAANQKASADNYNAQVAANGAQVSSWNRQMQDQQFGRESLMAEQQGSSQASNLELQNGSLEARNINNAATSGLAISGSTKDAIMSTAMNGEMNSLNAQYQGNLRSYQAQVQGGTATYNDEIQTQRDQDQSQLFSSEGSNATASGYLSAGGALLSGLSSGVNTADKGGFFN